MTGTTASSRRWARLRFVLSWAAALALVGIGLPHAVNVSWHGVVPVLTSIRWTAAVILVGLWFLGLVVHTFVLTAAAPGLTHRRALTLNVTGSAVSNVVPLGGAAGVELNRRMMKAWGMDARAFTGYTFLTNVWDVGAKLLLPLVALAALAHAGEAVAPLRAASTVAGAGFVGLASLAAALLASPRCAVAVGRTVERLVAPVLRLFRRDALPDVVGPLLDIRDQCARLVANGWLRMSVGMAGYVALQCVLLGFCLHVTGGGVSWTEVLAGFAVERLLTVIPITPGGVGLADLGLVGVLIALGGDPAGVASAAILYRLFVFAVEIPVGGGALGLWLLGRRRVARRVLGRAPADVRRVAHVTDVFLPRLGGIETHVDDLVRHQRARGLDAEVLTPTASREDDPAWVRRVRASEARLLVDEYDVVHVHLSMFSPFGIAVSRAAMAAGVPTLVTVHSMWAGAGALLRLAAFATLRRWPVAWSAVSDAAAEVFRRSLRRTDVAVLTNAVDVASWRPAVDPPRDAPLTVISVMRLAPRKRPIQLVRMFERVRALTPGHDVRLVVVGDGRLRGRMERAVRRRGLADHVRITGRLPREQVIDELRAAAVYVAPAPKESFGLAALEARCAGLPVVASRHGGVGEFVRDRQDGLLVGDDTEMAVAIAELVVDADLRARITDHNRRVAPRLDWSDALDRTDALYRTAVDRIRVPDAVPDLVAVPAVAS